MVNDEARKCRNELGAKLLAAMEESFLWEPSRPQHLLPEEMWVSPDSSRTPLSERECPGPGFPYRAMTELEVRAFAQGVGRMVANAWKANEKTYADPKPDPDLELHYRVQAHSQGRVLTLLERVLRGQYPGPGAN